MTVIDQTHVFHRHTAMDPPVAVGGDGVHILDRDGKRYLDASGGAAVSCLGHSHPAVIAAIREQVGRLSFAHSGFFTTEPMEALAEFLATRAPGRLDGLGPAAEEIDPVESTRGPRRQEFGQRLHRLGCEETAMGE